MCKVIPLYPILFLAISFLFFSCKTDKPKFGDIYIGFEYEGPKIDSSTTEPDQIIFKNVDGAPTVFVPNINQNACQDKVFMGTYPIGDTIFWHLRLVDPDGSPQHFKAVINENYDIVLINTALHFVLPHPTNFTATVEDCDGQQLIRIGN